MGLLARFRREYGAEPPHLVLLAASFAIAGYAIVRAFEVVSPLAFAVWLVGAVVAHDLVLLPLYTLVERGARRIAPRRAARSSGPAALNHLRVPAALSALLLGVWFPLILHLGTGYESLTGLPPGAYLERWLLVSAALFGLSALLYAVRRARAGPHRAADAGAGPRRSSLTRS
jgi:hypothetical protein